MEPHLFRVKPAAAAVNPTRTREEFLHVFSGEFEIWLGDTEHYRLKRATVLYLKAPRRIAGAIRRTEASLLWVILLRRFRSRWRMRLNSAVRSR